MNGELGDGRMGDPPIGGGISSFKPGGTAVAYGGSPRTKRPYITGTSSTPLGYYGTSTIDGGPYSKYPMNSLGSYRLASLDRLAHRQKLYETGSSPTGQETPPNASNITSITTTSVAQNQSDNGSSNGQVSPTIPTLALQNKREMFFKSDSTGGSVPAGAPPLHPSTAPPAPPVSTTVLPTVISTTSATTNNVPPPVPPQPSSIASIKEQLLTTKEKAHKDEENKENKMAKEYQRERKPREVDGYVGFANLPNQVYRKAVKKGFEFSLMVVGESGLGKSTLVNSMFLSDIYSNDHPGPSHRVKKTVQVETTKVLLKENGVNLLLTVVDTPGFGDAVDNSDCWQPISDYIENKYEEYLNAESQVNRKQIKDSRIHCCMYFIAAAGHGLKPLDIEFMRRLHDKVNIIPIIAKADTLTSDECQQLKKQILNEIAQHKIKIYEFPETDQDGVSLKMKNRVPFAVVGSNTSIEVDGKKVRGRKYPWGVVEVENLEHCDFIPLRNMMIRTHMQDLKDVTNNVHYENFRCKKLTGIGGADSKSKTSNKNPLAQMEEEKKEHTTRMRKMEVEMEQVFEMKVKEKMSKLQELETDLRKRNEAMRKKVEADLSEMNEERERFERDRKAWEAANNVTVEELRRKSLESLSKETVDGKSKKKKGLF